MAINVSGVDYKKGEAGIILSEMIMGGKMLQGGYVGNVFTAIKDTLNITYGSSDAGLIQNYACDFADGASITFADKVLSPIKFSVMEEACIDSLEQMWQAEQMAAGMNNSDLPATVGDFIAQHVAKKASAQIDSQIFVGTGTTQVNGYYTRAKADGNAIKVTSTTITKSNVVAAIETIYDALSENAKANSDVKIFVSGKDYGFYCQALGALGIYSGLRSTDPSVIGTKLFWDERCEVVPVLGLTTGKAFASAASNLFLGTDLESDANNVSVIDMRSTTGDRKYRVRMDYKIDANYADSTAVVVLN
ncbi:hypothetical protein UFOVP648_18 [uncultured Caudovirales phage]|uniref:Phage major capsid protein n=1 Tax=uncultured Caudovirales phage TaxID=2100421 RepID=A0A6J5N655_9CAUD|nr:hypothetical protein UFOVP648_18 [uncultured Caudovirales phage]